MDFGLYTLKDVEFLFIFDGETLNLFPKDEANKNKARDITCLKLANGGYALPGNPVEAESCLELFSRNHHKTLVLFPISSHYSVEGFFGDSLSLSIGNWFLVDRKTEISGISMHSQVLDFAYDIQKAVDYSQFDSEGNIEVKAKEKRDIPSYSTLKRKKLLVIFPIPEEFPGQSENSPSISNHACLLAFPPQVIMNSCEAL